MTRVPILRAREVIRALHRLGFETVRQRGSHISFRHADGRSTTVPDHGSSDLSRGMILKILRDARVSITDFLTAL